MVFVKLSLLLSTVHFCVVVLLFICFGIGLEGTQHFGHTIFWALLLPAAAFPLSGFWFIPLNSIFWGVTATLLLKVVHYLFSK